MYSQCPINNRCSAFASCVCCQFGWKVTEDLNTVPVLARQFMIDDEWSYSRFFFSFMLWVSFVLGKQRESGFVRLWGVRTGEV